VVLILGFKLLFLFVFFSWVLFMGSPKPGGVEPAYWPAGGDDSARLIEQGYSDF
jgi:hypothetical protein